MHQKCYIEMRTRRLYNYLQKGEILMKKLIAVCFALLIAMGTISVHAQEKKQCKINFLDILRNVKEKCENSSESQEKLNAAVEKLFKALAFLPVKEETTELDEPSDTGEEYEDAVDKSDTAYKPHHDTTAESHKNEEASKPSDIPDTGNSSYASRILQLVNSYRAENGVAPLTLDSELCSAAFVRATEIKTSFSHTRPNGQSCFTALSEMGISYNGAGENIAYGQSTADEVMTAWMNSQGHRANILNSAFKKLGVGVYRNNGVLYWAQFFTY